MARAALPSVVQNNTIAEHWEHRPDSTAQWSHAAVSPLFMLALDIAGIRPGEPGFLAEPDDVLGLRDGIALLLQNEAARLRMSGACRSSVLQDYDLSLEATRHADLYESVGGDVSGSLSSVASRRRTMRSGAPERRSTVAIHSPSGVQDGDQPASSFENVNRARVAASRSRIQTS